MKKLISILMIAGALAACNSNSSTESKGEHAADTTHIIPTDPAAQNDAATHTQPIPHDSMDYQGDTLANKKLVDSSKPR